jgi:hypothetical protein
MKALIGILGIAPVAIATSVGFAHLQAATNPLLDYCPAQTAGVSGSCASAAAMLIAVGSPSDDSLIASINAIADQVRTIPVRGASCADAADGIKALAGGIRNKAARTMAETVSATLCGPDFGGGAVVVAGSTLTVPVDPGAPPPPRTSSSSGGGGD